MKRNVCNRNWRFGTELSVGAREKDKRKYGGRAFFSSLVVVWQNYDKIEWKLASDNGTMPGWFNVGLVLVNSRGQVGAI